MRCLALVFVTLAAVAGLPATADASGSGIWGRVYITGTCGPTVSPGGSDTPPQPLDAAIEIRRPTSGKLLRRVRSGADGRYTVRLQPGHYVVLPGVAYGGGGIAQSKDRFRVRVAKGRFRRVDLIYDNGCR